MSPKSTVPLYLRDLFPTTAGGGGGGDGSLADSVLGATPAQAGAGVRKKRKKHGERRTIYHHDHVSEAAVAAAAPKVYNGVVYQRSPNGPFAGKLTAKGQVVSINGEDYVEYRVLAKV
ncbi:hypothetical protein BBAD15_g5567 [Beauveria bassiana D1-5]|uniref:Uncharacterized protein n=1 Tax=Beauveria bassiana D1-5 TaxID=1245745 RepID=A0A0A2VN98_BEABA|nr:hypothetical protein BBAD15_g5567 [Beauveria bassiana D1-5]